MEILLQRFVSVLQKHLMDCILYCAKHYVPIVSILCSVLVLRPSLHKNKKFFVITIKFLGIPLAEIQGVGAIGRGTLT